MELIFVFSIVLFEICLINFFKTVEVIRTLGIDAFMDDEILAVFLWNKGVATVWTPEFNRRKTAFFRRKSGIADFTQELPFGTIIPVKKRFWSIAAGAGAVIRNVTFRTAAYGADFLAVSFFIVRDQIFVSPVLPEIRD